jgi:type II secretory pathway component GspD/PulD (secretin)
MRTTLQALIACSAVAASTIVLGQASDSSSVVREGGTPLIQLIESVSKKSGKSFIVDPRVNGNAVLVGVDASKVGYPELLTILQVHGFSAIETGGMVRVIPDTNARTAPSPLIAGNDKRPDAELVTRILKVKSVPAAQLVPILRSLLPQNAHLAAFPCTNELIVVDTFANVRRIESVVASMDKGEPLTLEKCTGRETPGVPRTAPTPQPAEPPR